MIRVDHVAVAVPDPDAALARWRDDLGGGLVADFTNPRFTGRQVLYPNGGKLELLGPAPDAGPDNFVASFLARFGTRVHHLTLKVPDLDTESARVRAAGLEVVDERRTPTWSEGFLRPSQVGGLVVQLAQTPYTDEQWAEERGLELERPAEGAPSLLGPRLRHPDLDAAERIWSLLGADVGRTARGELFAVWPDSAISVLVEEGEPAGPVSLRMAGTSPLPHDDALGPAVE